MKRKVKRAYRQKQADIRLKHTIAVIALCIFWAICEAIIIINSYKQGKEFNTRLYSIRFSMSRRNRKISFVLFSLPREKSAPEQ